MAEQTPTQKALEAARIRDRKAAKKQAAAWTDVQGKVQAKLASLSAAAQKAKDQDKRLSNAAINDAGALSVRREVLKHGQDWITATESAVNDVRGQSIQKAIKDAQKDLQSLTSIEEVIAPDGEKIQRDMEKAHPTQRILAASVQTSAQRAQQKLQEAARKSRPQDFGEVFMNAVAATSSKAYTVIATEETRAARVAQLEVYRLNAEAADITGWMWFARPDSCGACAAMAGTIHPLEDQLESHPNCRCVMIPIIAGQVPDVVINKIKRSDPLAELEARLGNKTLARAIKDGYVSPDDLIIEKTKGKYSSINQASYVKARDKAKKRIFAKTARPKNAQAKTIAQQAKARQAARLKAIAKQKTAASKARPNRKLKRTTK